VRWKRTGTGRRASGSLLAEFDAAFDVGVVADDADLAVGGLDVVLAHRLLAFGRLFEGLEEGLGEFDQFVVLGGVGLLDLLSLQPLEGSARANRRGRCPSAVAICVSHS
jgi:hypothetical protein